MSRAAALLALPLHLRVQRAVLNQLEHVAESEPQETGRFLRRVLRTTPQEDFANGFAMRVWATRSRPPAA
jgi:hypothetical protein